MATRAGPVRTQAAQAPVAAGYDLSRLYMCSECAIRYEVARGSKARCPLCAQNHKIHDLELEREVLVGENNTLRKKVEFLERMSDDTAAMRSALHLLDESDRAFLKSALYLYRSDRAYRIRPGRTVAKPKAPMNLAQLTLHGREVDARIFTSMGGVAVLGYYEELIREAGEVSAMMYLMRALGLHLAKEGERGSEHSSD